METQRMTSPQGKALWSPHQSCLETPGRLVHPAPMSLNKTCVTHATWVNLNTLCHFYYFSININHVILRRVFMFLLDQSSQIELGKKEMCSDYPRAICPMSCWSTAPAVLRLVCLWCLWVSDETIVSINEQFGDKVTQSNLHNFFLALNVLISFCTRDTRPRHLLVFSLICLFWFLMS